MLFATYLAEQNLSYPTIRVYLSAVRYNCTTMRESLPLTTPRLNYILKGICKSDAMTYQPREWLPITFPIMMRLHQTFTTNSSNYGDVMIWAACCLAYFGLLRVSEFTSSAHDHFDPSMDLLLSDVALDSRASPSLIQITIKHSKGDQFRKREQICLGKTTHAVCPVRALVKYLARQGGTPGPLFVWPNNKALARASFSSAINKAFQKLHMDPHDFNTHSFRIGAATSAKQAGMSDSHLKALGRWWSDAYLRYIRLSPQDLAGLSKSLAVTSSSSKTPN